MKLSIFKNNFGELEEEIMKTLWGLKSASVRDVLIILGKKRKIAYTTVMTVMSRLTEKGFLKRRMVEDGSYIYTPIKDKEDFFALASKTAVRGLLKEYGEVAIAQFIDALESSSLKNLEEWKRKLKKII